MNKDVLGPLAALVKRAQAADFNLQSLEALRQNALATHQTTLAGARQGGGAAGAVGGGGLGLGAALRAALPALLKSKMGMRGKLSVGSLAAGAGALGGGMAGRMGGRAVGGASVGKLPDFMEQPVTAGNMTQVAGHLAKGAFDIHAIRAALEKQAGIGQALGSMWGGAKSLAKPLFTAPTGKQTFNRAMDIVPQRAFSPGRTAATMGGTAYGGALLGHHTGMLSSDPTQGMTTEQKYRHHMGEYNQMANPLRQQVESGYGKGTPEGFAEGDKAMTELEGGNFGGSGILRNNMLTRTFTPWLAGDRNAGFHQQQAGAANQEFQTELDRVRGINSAKPGQYQAQLTSMQQRLQNPQLMPQHRQLIQAQMAKLQQQMQGMSGADSPEAQALVSRMRGAGMQIGPSGGGGGGGYAPRPQTPSAAPHYMNRNDFPNDHQYDSWETMAQQGGVR